MVSAGIVADTIGGFLRFHQFESSSVPIFGFCYVDKRIKGQNIHLRGLDRIQTFWTPSSGYSDLKQPRAVRLAGIFQGICSNCHHESAVVADGSMAILINRDDPALRIPLNEKLVSNDIGELPTGDNFCLLELAHPLEDSILHSTGISFPEASYGGRLVLLTSVVCRKCGTVYNRRRLTVRTGSAGCLIALAAFFSVSPLAGLWLQSFWVGLASGYAVLMLVSACDQLVAWLFLQRFRNRAKALALPANCPKCGSTSAQSVTRSRRVPCPECGQFSVRFRMTAIS